ncbi:energy transducer TonB, partial [Basilea psittacipulmonis]
RQEREAKRLAEQKAKAEKAKAEREAAALRAAMRGTATSVAGIAGGVNDKNQLGGAGGTSDYQRAVQSCVQPHLIFNGGTNLQLRYRVYLDEQRHPIRTEITRRSGNPAFDRAVQNALMACDPYPPSKEPVPVINGIYKYKPIQ